MPSNLVLTKANSELWERYLKHIATHLSCQFARELVLKGGTALRIAYGLPRNSYDLDYESLTLPSVKQDEKALIIQHVHDKLTDCLKVACSQFLHEQVGINPTNEITHVIAAKFSPKHRGVQYYVTHSLERNVSEFRHSQLKIDLGFNLPFEDYKNDIREINGIFTFNAETLMESKLSTLTGAHPRFKFKDYFDANFILEKYQHKIHLDTFIRLKLHLEKVISKDLINTLQKQVAKVADYRYDFTPSDVPTVIIRLCEKVELLRKKIMPHIDPKIESVIAGDIDNKDYHFLFLTEDNHMRFPVHFQDNSDDDMDDEPDDHHKPTF